MTVCVCHHNYTSHYFKLGNTAGAEQHCELCDCNKFVEMENNFE
jgi:hypothetical protein